MDNSLGFLFILVAVIAIGGLITWAVLHGRWIKALEQRGWRFESNPGVDITYGLNVPPFGLGLQRRVDDLIHGPTPGGVAFMAFDYGYDSQRRRIATFALPVNLPEAHLVRRDAIRPGTQVPMAGQINDVVVLAHDPRWGEVVARAAEPGLAALAAAAGGIDLTIDGNRLTVYGSDRDPARLEAFVRAVDPIVAALCRQDLSAFATGPLPGEMSFYHLPTWIYRPADDRMLQAPSVTDGGKNHAAEDVVIIPDSGVEHWVFRHEWETTRTVTETDSEGRTHTRTVTDHHREDIHDARLLVPFSDLSLDHWELFGNRKQTFESIDFDAQHTVRAANPEFASNVIHPRMMEWMMSRPTTPFRIEGPWIRFDGTTDLNEVRMRADFMQGFFSRVPNFVWKRLGLADAPGFREVS